MCHFFTGDPLFAGVHRFEEYTDGRSYRRMSHFCSPDHQIGYNSTPTIVLAEHEEWWHLNPRTIVHEIGHFIHWVLDNEDFELPAVSDYAATNHHEAFAEAFTAYHIPYGYSFAEAKDRLTRDDYRFFDYICHESSRWKPLWMP